MKFFILLLASVIVCSSGAAILDTTLENFWTEFKSFHKKTYESASQEMKRRSIWETNLKKINQHNLEHSLGHHTYTLKMNKYGDLTNKEFATQMNGFNMTKKLSLSSVQKHNFLKVSNVKIPDSVDWRTQG
jgi:pyoverdine/dityrosine biosynthesis protein Dit1